MREAIGIIVPSGNVVVERTAVAMAATLPQIDVHFARVPIRGSTDPFPDGYDVPSFLTAAQMLADVRPGAIVWAGSKGILVGMDQEQDLRRQIEAETAVPFTSSSLALIDLVARTGLRRIALITPYADSYQKRLIQGFARIDIECVSEEHCGISDNLAYADIPEGDILHMCERAGRSRPDAIVAWCTNFRAAAIGAEITRLTELPFYDATVLALDHAVKMVDRSGLREGLPVGDNDLEVEGSRCAFSS